MSTKNKDLVSRLSRAAKAGFIDVAAGAAALKTNHRQAALVLGSLARRGWFRRIRRGLYYALPIESATDVAGVEDSWSLAMRLFSPCYIGGWSAAEHWGLTEQIFRDTLVVTWANVRLKKVTLLAVPFILYRSVTRSEIGLIQVWHSNVQVQVSGPERTIVDGLRRPQICGGIRHLAQMMREYASSQAFKPSQILSIAAECANGAAWKRLGFLAEVLWPDRSEIISKAHEQVTRGIVSLDPSVRRRGHINTRWGLFVNSVIAGLEPPE